MSCLIWRLSPKSPGLWWCFLPGFTLVVGAHYHHMITQDPPGVSPESPGSGTSSFSLPVGDIIPLKHRTKNMALIIFLKLCFLTLKGSLLLLFNSKWGGSVRVEGGRRFRRIRTNYTVYSPSLPCTSPNPRGWKCWVFDQPLHRCESWPSTASPIKEFLASTRQARLSVSCEVGGTDGQHCREDGECLCLSRPTNTQRPLVNFTFSWTEQTLRSSPVFISYFPASQVEP